MWGSDERITDDTLIRVDVDLMLALANTLPGAVDAAELGGVEGVYSFLQMRGVDCPPVAAK